MKRNMFLCCAAMMATLPVSAAEQKVTRYARFQIGDRTAYGIVDGDTVTELDGDLFGSWRQTETTHVLTDIKLLAPTKPSKVLAMAGNYPTHLHADQEKPGNPELFFKLPSCIIGPGDNIVHPKGSKDVHFEGELVIVIGKRAKNISEADVPQYVLGVTCGDDVSARDWQKNDRQWWRAKGTDTFGPCGPFIVSGIDYDNLQLQTRVNGEVKQKENTKSMIFNVAQMVSFISKHVTLEPGDIIYTGTPGKTSAIKPGDMVEVEIENIGTLRNKVVAEQ